MFLVWRGRFRVEFRDTIADMGQGEFVVVPRGVEHRTAADDEAEILVFDPAEVLNTGNVVDPVFTAPTMSGSDTYGEGLCRSPDRLIVGAVVGF